MTSFPNTRARQPLCGPAFGTDSLSLDVGRARPGSAAFFGRQMT
jgi:hypothetical protein